MTDQERSELAYALRMLAEAWWNLADTVERGEDARGRFVKLAALTASGVEQTGRLLSVPRRAPSKGD